MKRNKSLRLTILMIVISFFSQIFLFSQTSSQIPGGTDNYLQVANSLSAGGYDEYAVIFFEIPDTVSSTLYFAVYDPDMYYDAANVESDSSEARAPWGATVTGITSYFSLVGGSGTLSNEKSRYIYYNTGGGDDPLGPGMGTVLDQFINTNTASDEGWVYFSGINPVQGELIGNKRYFKIVVYATTTAGWIKNGFKLDVSLSNSGNPTGVTGIRSFAYAWPIFLNATNTWYIYPFVPETLAGGNIVFSNFDMDTSYPGGFPGAPSATADWCYAFDKNSTPLADPALSRENEYFETSYPVTAGLTNGTWTLQIQERSDTGAGDGVNLSEFWFTDQLFGGATVQTGGLRAYSSPFTNPPAAANVSVNKEDGLAINDNSDTEKLFIQIVDSNGDPAPYSRNIWVQVDGSAVIDNANTFYSGYSAGSSSALITTSSEGLGWVTIRDSVAEIVTAQFAANGTTLPGTDGNEANFSSTVQSLTVNFVANPDPVMSSTSNLSFINTDTGTALDLPNIIITEVGATSITNTADSLVVRIPSGLSVLFDTGFTPSFSGSVAVASSTLQAGQLIITPNAGFNAGDTLIISGLRFDATSDSPSSGKLELSYTGTGGNFDVIDDKIITIIDSNPNFIWDGSTSTSWTDGTNWIGNAAPSAPTDNVIIPDAGGNMPLLTTTTTLQSLYIESGATLTFSGTDLNITGALTVQGTLVVNGALNAAANVSGNGLLNASGGASVSVSGDLILANYTATAGTTTIGGDFTIGTSFTHSNGTLLFNGGATSMASGSLTYYNVTIATGTTLQLAAASSVVVANDLVVNGTLEAGGNLQVGGNVSGSGTLDDINNGTMDFNGNLGVATYDATNGTTTLAGDWSVTSLTHNNGTISFDGAGTSHVTSDNTFYNLLFNTGSKTVEFDAGTTQTVAASINVDASLVVSGALSVTSNISGTGALDASSGSSIGVGGDLIVANYTATAGTTTIGGDFTISTSFTHSNGTLLFNGGATSVASGSLTYYNLTIATGTTLQLAAASSVVVANDLVVNGTLEAGGNLEVGGNVSGSGTLDDINNGTMDFNGNLGVATYDATNGTTTLAGDWSVTSLTHNNGTISFDGTGTSHVTSDNTFYNLLFNTGGKTVEFDAGTTQTVDGQLNINAALVVSGDMSVSGSITGSGSLNASLGGAISVSSVISVNTYSATANTTTVGGDWSVSTLTHNDGTIEFNGTGTSHITTDNSFYNLTCVTASKVIQVNTGTTQNVANTMSSVDNLVVDGTLNINGTLSVSGNITETATGTIDASGGTSLGVSGDLILANYIATSGSTNIGGDFNIGTTFTHNSGTLVFNGGATSVAYGSLSYYNLTIASGTTLQFEAASSIIVGNNLIVNGTLEVGGNLQVGGDVSGSGTLDDINNGTMDFNGNFGVATYDATSGTTTVAGDWSVTNLTHNSGTIEFDGGGSSLASGSITYNALNITSGTTLQFPALSSPTVNSALGIAGILEVGENLTVNGDVSGSGALNVLNNGTMDFNGDLGVSTYSATNTTTTVAGDWSVTTFTPNGGAVIFDTTATSIISGSHGFYDLSSTTPGKTLQFTAGTTQTISNVFTVQGSSGNELVLESTVPGTQWNLILSSGSASYVAVSDSNASSIIDAANSTDNGNNIRWAFGAGPSISTVTAAGGPNVDAAFGNGDTLTFVFSEATNEVFGPTLTRGELQSLFVGLDLGADFQGSWIDASTLVITIIDSSGATSDTTLLSATFELDPTAGLRNAAETTRASDDVSDPLLGTWTTIAAPQISSVTAAGGGIADTVFGNDDTMTFVFSENTNQVFGPLLDKAELQSLFVDINLGANFTGEWVDASTLVITVIDATGADPSHVVLDNTATFQIDSAAGLRNAAGNSLDSNDVSPPLTGTWTTPEGPSITSATASDPDNGDDFYSNGDIITIIFSENTNQPSVANQTEIDTLFSSLNLGTSYSATWSAADTLIITITDVSGVISAPTTITIDAAGNLLNAAATSVPSTATASISGNWGTTVTGGIESSLTDDTDGNGKIDLITVNVQAPSLALNDDFSGLSVSVAGYQVLSFNTGVTSNDSVFNIVLAEGSALDTGATPGFSIVANTSLKYSGTERLIQDSNVVPLDSADPVIGYTLAMADKNQIFVVFSEYILAPGGASSVSPADFGYSGGLTISGINLFSIQGNGAREVLINLNGGNISANDILTETNVTTAGLEDMAGNVIQLAERTHRVSDLGLGLANDSVVQPVYAQDETSANPDLAGVTMVTDFDGSGFVRNESLQLQAHVHDSISAAGVSVTLFYDLEVPENIKNAQLWLPGDIVGLVPSANSAARSVAGVETSAQLRDFAIARDDEMASGSSFEFVFEIGTNTLYCARVENPDASDWYRSITPWVLNIREISQQDSNVNVLNNVINPNQNEFVYFNYTVPRDGRISIMVFDMKGDIIDVLKQTRQEKGEYMVEWNGRNRGGRAVARGVYFIKIIGPGIEEIRKVLVVK